MDNNNLYQFVLGFSAVAGYLGAIAVLVQIPGLPLWLALIIAPFLGYAYGETQAAIVGKFPRIRERGEVTTSGLCKVGCPFLMILLLWGIFFIPAGMQAREKARAAGHRVPELPSWAPLAAMALPVALSGLVAVVGWRLRATRQRRGR
jgi:hypothetical protein